MSHRRAPSSSRKRVVLRTAAGRSLASQRWLTRQLNDPYVQAARAAGFRSRSAFKLLELNERFHLVKKNARVLDLGAAPGGWTQAALAAGAGRVVAVDLLPLQPVAGAKVLTGDAADPETMARIRSALDGPADLVLSDMAPAITGHAATDHIRIVVLAECAAEIAYELLTPGGALVVKLFQGGAEAALLQSLKRAFTLVRHAKPAASRASSREVYLVAIGFRSPPCLGDHRARSVA